MAILGLIGTEQFASERWTNIRSSVFYNYPAGSAPLIGLLSMLPSEETNDPSFTIYEKRLYEQRTLTITQGTSKGPFLVAAGTDLGDPGTITKDTEYQVCVASSEKFRVSHVIKIKVDLNSAASSGEVKGIVTSIVDATHIKFRAINTTSTIDNGTTNENVGKEVLVIGSANAQFATMPSGQIWTLPTAITNYTQIFRTPFSFSRTALKAGAKFDKSGPYKDKAKENSLNHMREMEFAFLFGDKTAYNTGGGTDAMPTFTTGGILYFLNLWEAGSTYGNSAATADTDDNKRIIANVGGSINEKSYDKYLERIFRYGNNVSSDRICFCGSGFLSVMNQLYKSKSCLDAGFPTSDSYGMSVVKHISPFGTIYYKSHPLFSINDALRYNALFCDVQNLRFRPLLDSDTELLKNRQARDADGRTDEWLTEAGLELRMPESFLYLQNVQDYVP